MGFARTPLAFLFLLCLLSTAGHAQRYRPLYEVEPLSESINSSGEESKPIMIGDSLFFSRSFHEDNIGVFAQDIWYSYRDSVGNWVPASNEIEHVNDEFNNVILGASPDGSTYYLLNSYKLKVIPRLAISFVQVSDRGISRPKDLKIKDYRPEDQFYDAYVDGGSGIIIVSMNFTDSYGAEDLYLLRLGEKGKYSVLRNLGDVVNTEGFEIAPFLTPDRRRLYFASNGHGGEGDADIFFVDRLDSSWTNWSEPVNLGAPINSSGFDAYYYETGSDEAYFSSLRDGGDFADLYLGRLVGEELIPGTEPIVEPEPDVVLAGGDISVGSNADGGTNVSSNTGPTNTTNGTASNASGRENTNTNITNTGQPIAQNTETTSTQGESVNGEPTTSGDDGNAAGNTNTPVANMNSGTTIPTTLAGAENSNESESTLAVAAAEGSAESPGAVTKPITLDATYLPPDRTVFFALDSDKLDLNGEVVLEMMVTEWKRQPELVLFIEGHTDDAGDKPYNLDLANRRAQTVRDYLLSKGLEEYNFVIMAVGEANPAVQNSDARNRRVELYFQRGFRR